MASSLHQKIAGEQSLSDQTRSAQPTPRPTTSTCTATSRSNAAAFNTFGTVYSGEGGELSNADFDNIFRDENEPVDTHRPTFAPPAPVLNNITNCSINITYNFK